VVGGTVEEWRGCATLGTAKIAITSSKKLPTLQRTLATFHKDVESMREKRRKDVLGPICVAEAGGKLTYSETTKTVILIACRDAQGQLGV
jgi:hypothetical protein